MPIVTLTSDFGSQDHYVAALKGVLLQLAPKVILVDITHEIAPHNVLQAAFTLRQAWPWFPRGTVHLVVVDPGVGTGRRILAGQYGGQYFVAPDNGVISLVHQAMPAEGVHLVENRSFFGRVPSATFHGRDIMAPVAALLTRGGSLREVGPPTDRLEVLPVPRPTILRDYSIHGAVVYVDHFGNCITNIPRADLTTALIRNPLAEVSVAGRSIGPLRNTYGEVPIGSPVPLVGSSELLEIAVNQGSASRALGLSVGSQVVVGAGPRDRTRSLERDAC